MPDAVEAPEAKKEFLGEALDEALADSRSQIDDLDLFKHEQALQRAVDNEWITEFNRQEWLAWLNDASIDPQAKKAALNQLEVKPGSEMAKQQQLAEERQVLLKKEADVLKAHPELADKFKDLTDKHKFFDVLDKDERKNLVAEIKSQVKDLKLTEAPDAEVEAAIAAAIPQLDAAKANGSISAESADKWVAWFKDPNTPPDHIRKNVLTKYLADHAPLAARQGMLTNPNLTKLLEASNDSNFAAECG